MREIKWSTKCLSGKELKEWGGGWGFNIFLRLFTWDNVKLVSWQWQTKCLLKIMAYTMITVGRTCSFEKHDLTTEMCIYMHSQRVIILYACFWHIDMLLLSPRGKIPVTFQSIFNIEYKGYRSDWKTYCLHIMCFSNLIESTVSEARQLTERGRHYSSLREVIQLGNHILAVL